MARTLTSNVRDTIIIMNLSAPAACCLQVDGVTIYKTQYQAKATKLVWQGQTSKDNQNIKQKHKTSENTNFGIKMWNTEFRGAKYVNTKIWGSQSFPKTRIQN